MAQQPTSKYHDLLHRIFRVSHWNLLTRFVYTTGLILLVGALTTLFTVSYTLKKAAEQSIYEKLDDFEIIVNQLIKTTSDNLLDNTLHIASTKDILSTVAESNHRQAELTVNTYNNISSKFTDRNSPDILLLTKELEPFYSTSATLSTRVYSDEPPSMVGSTQKFLRANQGLEVNPGGLLSKASLPVISNHQFIGMIVASRPIEHLLNRLSAIIQGPYGITILLNEKERLGEVKPTRSDFPTPPAPSIVHWGVANNHMVMDSSEFRPGNTDIHNNHFIKAEHLHDYAGNKIGTIQFHFDGSEILANSNSTILMLTCLTIFGVLLLSLSLYVNVLRLKSFFRRMKKLLIASQATDFSLQFDTLNIHCKDALACTNSSCPVFHDSTKICYLEAGDDAISPTLRNSCTFLATYTTCSKCPVYNQNQGDELTEMQHLVNTIMGLWSNFLGTVSNLLADVYSNRSKNIVGLEDVSHYLTQIADLTSYSRDLQGVLNKEEVHKQLGHIFRHKFALNRFNLLEVNSSENRLVSVITGEELGESHMEVFVNCDLCRAKRVAEDVISENSPHLCPYFGIDHQEEVRCCMPMVMGGKVGAVFTFVVSRDAWQAQKSQLVIMKKYLNETAPVLSSLRLLQISKEQALKDPLTLCYNRRFMDQYLVHFESLNSRTPRNLGFIMADLDHFKMVNDEFGHQAGDDILKQLAEILRKNIRKSDLLIRYGGEEFLIILLEMKEPGRAVTVAEKIRVAVESTKLALPNGGNLTKTLSMGVAEFPSDGDQLYKVIKYADVALYQAKNSGRNKVLRFDEEMWQDTDY